MNAEDRAALRAKVTERWNGWGLHPANLMPVGTLADQIDLLDDSDALDRLVAGIEALDGMTLITAERRRQVEVEGWTSEHDRGHGSSRLLRAGEAYMHGNPSYWPWDAERWKPRDRLSDLIRAGALFLAAADMGASLSGNSGARDCATEIDGILARVRALLPTREQETGS